jgi:hypothetical protein
MQKMFPFTAGGIRRAAAPQEFRFFHLGDYFFRIGSGGFFKRGKAARFFIFRC